MAQIGLPVMARMVSGTAGFSYGRNRPYPALPPAAMPLRPLAFLLIGALLLAALAVFLKPTPPLPPPLPPRVLATVPALPTPPAAPLPKTLALRFSQGQVQGGVATLQLRVGEALTISLLSDVPGQLHLHGYNLHADVQANQPAQLAFTATQAGRFDLELHGSHHVHADLAALEVLPQ